MSAGDDRLTALADGLVVIGRCPRCGVQCAGRREDGGRLEKMLGAHAEHCVGNDRAGETWVPFGHDLPRW